MKYKQQWYTTIEVCQELGVYQTAINNMITRLKKDKTINNENISEYISKKGRNRLISHKLFVILEERMQTKQKKEANTQAADTSILLEQLKVKDEQIAALNKALDQQQQLSLVVETRNKDLEHELNNYKAIEQQKEYTNKKKGNFFSNLFKKE